MPVELMDLHFLRPAFLWLIIPLIALIYQVRGQSSRHSAWQSVISPHLLEFLFVGGQKNRSHFGLWMTGLIILLAILAASGPSIRQKSVPVFQTEDAKIILLDLSLSMDATDIKPSRLERAKFKLLDLLEQTKEGTIGLVVYAGDAFVISPLTSDARTIANMVPTLSTSLMPVLGSRPDLAIDKALELLENARYSRGQLIWLTDGVDTQFIQPIVSSIKNSTFKLAILAIGTEQGAPIPLPDKSGFLKDQSGSIVVPKLQTAELNEIVSQTNSAIIELTADDRDIQYLIEQHQWQTTDAEEEIENSQLINRWIDDGYWLVWLIVPLFLIKIIRQPIGQYLSYFAGILLLTCNGLYAPPVAAIEWQDLWKTKTQQAEEAFNAGEYQDAARLFEDQQWKGTALYKSGEYADAASQFKSTPTTRSRYNHATSLAKANQLQEALDAYNQLLEKEPQHEDALFNKKIIEDLLQQQKEQQEQQQQDQQDSEEKQDQDQQSEDSQSDSQEQSEEQKSEEQQQNEQESEQQTEQKQAELSEDERDQAEKDQALEHWLEKIPDDPGGLLRRKMYREYQRRGRQQKEEKLW